MVLSFFLNLLATVSVMKIHYLLYIHGIYKHTAMWGSEEGSNLNFSVANKEVYIHHKIYQPVKRTD